MIKGDDIRSLTVDEIDEKINQCKKEHFNLRFQAKTGKLDKRHKIGEIKKDIARLLTIKNEIKE